MIIPRQNFVRFTNVKISTWISFIKKNNMHLTPMTPIQESYGDMLVKGPVGVVIDEWDFRSQPRY